MGHVKLISSPPLVILFHLGFWRTLRPQDRNLACAPQFFSISRQMGIPLPAALMGLAVGWVFLKMSRGNKSKTIAKAPAGPLGAPASTSTETPAQEIEVQVTSPTESNHKRPAPTGPFDSPSSQQSKIKALKRAASPPMPTPPPSSPGSSSPVEPEQTGPVQPIVPVNDSPGPSPVYSVSNYSPMSSSFSQSPKLPEALSTEESLDDQDTPLPSPLTLVSTATEDDEKLTSVTSEEFGSPIPLERSGSFTRFKTKVKGSLRRLSSISSKGSQKSNN